MELLINGHIFADVHVNGRSVCGVNAHWVDIWLLLRLVTINLASAKYYLRLQLFEQVIT